MNTPRVCMQETKKAFRKLSKEDMLGAVQALCNLKGVGPQMASGKSSYFKKNSVFGNYRSINIWSLIFFYLFELLAVLAAGAPHLAPFMADECLWAMPDVDSLDYTIKEYMSYIEHMKACAERINENGKSSFSKYCNLWADKYPCCRSNFNIFINFLGASNWTPHGVELAVWTYYILHDLKPELLQELPSAKNSISASDRFENQTNDAAKDDTDKTHNNSSAAKSPAENSTDRSIPLSTEETNTEEPGTVIPTNGQGSNELSNHNIAADSGGSTNSSIITESNDAKAEKMVQGDHSIDQRKESDLNSEASRQNVTPIMTNGKGAIPEKNTLSPSQMNHDAQSYPSSMVSKATNGTHNKDVKMDETSKNRLQSDDSSVNIAPENGNSNNGIKEVT